MSDSKESSKAAKKAAKAEAKARKKAAKLATKVSVGQSAAASDSSQTDPLPAERSALAAERQVEINRRRFWIMAIGVLIALASLIVTLRKDLFSSRNSDSNQPAPAEKNASVKD